MKYKLVVARLTSEVSNIVLPRGWSVIIRNMETDELRVYRSSLTSELAALRILEKIYFNENIEYLFNNSIVWRACEPGRSNETKSD